MRKPRLAARGQTLVEYALMLPILLVILVVIFDMGRGIYYYSVIHNAAREGARYGIIHPNDSTGIESKARNLAVGLEPSSLVITSEHQVGTDLNRIKVTVRYAFDPVTPFVEDLLGGVIELTSISSMNVEG